MVWFKVDDNFADHAKVRRIPRNQRVAAIGLWTLAGTWAARHLRDGQVPAYMIEELCAKPASADALVRVGLWHAHGHDCDECPPTPADSFVFHDWASQQYTREQVMAKREADAERQRLARERRRQEQDQSQRESRDRHAVTDSDEGVSHGSVQTPVPSRPVPVPSLKTSRASSGVQRPETLDPADARCTDHQGIEDPPNCRGCMKARENAERARDLAIWDKKITALNCPDCFGDNWLLNEAGETVGKCDHRRTA